MWAWTSVSLVWNMLWFGLDLLTSSGGVHSLHDTGQLSSMKPLFFRHSPFLAQSSQLGSLSRHDNEAEDAQDQLIHMHSTLVPVYELLIHDTVHAVSDQLPAVFTSDYIEQFSSDQALWKCKTGSGHWPSDLFTFCSTIPEGDESLIPAFFWKLHTAATWYNHS